MRKELVSAGTAAATRTRDSLGSDASGGSGSGRQTNVGNADSGQIEGTGVVVVGFISPVLLYIH